MYEHTGRMGANPRRPPQHRGQRDNINTATNRDSRWLVPGRRADQATDPKSLAALVHNVGIPTVTGRTAAIR